ncbi:hypothetical protein [Spongiactinospora sp. 9N601]|uniref:hypothetical protein n=1 Tax=Spongiactinospora sp. 9N601 TaxID=3375149 RepID=UPI0037A3D7A7
MKSLIRTLVIAGAAAAVILPGVSAEAAAIPHYKKPKVFGMKFQADPHHDFSKGLHSRHNGILRGWITEVRGGVAEYEPIRWKLSRKGHARFVGPPEYDVMAYASPIAKDMRFYSAYGCKISPSGTSYDDNASLGAKRCSTKVLLERTKRFGPAPALITVHKGAIVKVQEIFTT